MIYILHGDDNVASRKFLNDLVEGFKITNLEGKTLRLPEFEESLVSTDLFGDKKAVIVENLLSKNLRKKDFIKFLNDNPPSVQLILWEDKKILKTSIAGLKSVTVRDFFLPSYYFQFLDSFVPSNNKGALKLFHTLQDSYAPEQLFFSLIKRIRSLVILSQGEKNLELAKMSPWQLSNLQKQLKLWRQDSLLIFYKKLLSTEIKLKTGKLPTTLSKHLDILILSELT